MTYPLNNHTQTEYFSQYLYSLKHRPLLNMILQLPNAKIMIPPPIDHYIFTISFSNFRFVNHKLKLQIPTICKSLYTLRHSHRQFQILLLDTYELHNSSSEQIMTLAYILAFSVFLASAPLD